MHKSSLARMKWFEKNYLTDLRSLEVLDVGSYNVNGCYKEIFTECGHKYTGLDMENGPNVDICPELPYIWKEIDEDTYDVVVSGQALEHIEFFWVTMEEIIRVTKKNGLICIIVPNGFKEHRYPVDCWRFFTDGMIAIARFNKLEILHAHTNCAPNTEDGEWYSEDCADTMLIAKKTYNGKAKKVDLEQYKCVPAQHSELRQGFATYEEFKKDNKEMKERPSNKKKGIREMIQLKKEQDVQKDSNNILKKYAGRINKIINYQEQAWPVHVLRRIISWPKKRRK